MNNIFLFPWLMAFLIAFLTTPVVISLAKKLKIIDDPRTNKHPKVIHTVPTPRAGGVVIFLSIVITILIFLPVDKKIIGIILGALILTVMGVIDDKHNLNPYLRLILGFLAASIPVGVGIGISFISNPFGGIIDLSIPRINFTFFGSHSIWILSDLFALFWITFLMNVINMGAKGVDGQLSGVTTISALTIALMSLKFSTDYTQVPVIIIAVALSGAFLGFLPWHINPQKIMPGYGGSTLAGYFLAVLSILSTTKVGVLLVVLGIPIIDTFYTIFRRIIQKKSPVWGDRGHLHHRLLDAGLTKTQVAVFYWITTGLLGILALNLNTMPKIYTIVGVALFVGGLIIWLKTKSLYQH